MLQKLSSRGKFAPERARISGSPVAIARVVVTPLVAPAGRNRVVALTQPGSPVLIYSDFDMVVVI